MGFGKQENMRRILILVLTIATLMAASISIASAAPPDHAGRPDHAVKPDKPVKPVKPERGPAEKVDVCHFSSGAEEFHLINVSGNALDAHLAHGDKQPGDAVEGIENYEFVEDCGIRTTRVVEASFSNAGLAVSFAAYVSFDQVVSGVGSYSYSDALTENDMSMTVRDVCIDEVNSVATIWGSGSSTLWGEGFVVLTIADDGGSMSTRAVFHELQGEAEASFAGQCLAPDLPMTDGVGSLIFG